MAPATTPPVASTATIMDALETRQDAPVYVVVSRRASQVADSLGISRGHMSMILNGKRMPSLPLARKIAQALGVSTDELYEQITNQSTAAA